MLLRISTAAVLLALVAAAFLLAPMRWVALAMAIAMGMACVEELAALAGRRGTMLSRRVAMALVVALIYLGWRLRIDGIALAMGAAVIAALGARLRRPAAGALGDSVATIGSVAYIGLPLAAMMAMFAHSDATRAWLLLMLVVVWATDTAAMFAGKALGRHKMAPAISPGKTWEGAVGGAAGAIVAAAVVAKSMPETFGAVPLLELALLAVATSAIGQAGDLAESMLKRDAGVKDSGRSIPGHGGALDRIDSLLFTSVPFAAYLWLARPGLF